MSIIPVLINLARGLEEDYSPVDDDFGFGIHPGDIFRPRSSNSLLLHPGHRFNPYERRICRRRRESSGNDVLNGKIAKPSVGKDGFQVCMDVSHFKPNELTVKTVDNKIVVEGNHEEREDDHGFVTRKFTRKYILPKGFDAKDVVSTMSSDGVLTIKAPPLPKSSKSNERIIQIQQTGPAHLCVKDNNQTDADSVKNGSEKIDARSK